GRNQKTNCISHNRTQQAIHKNSITNIEIAIFAGKNLTEKRSILGHALIQICFVVHHFLDGPFIIAEIHLVKVPKEKKIDLPFRYLFSCEHTFGYFWFCGQYSENNCNYRNAKKKNRR